MQQLRSPLMQLPDLRNQQHLKQRDQINPSGILSPTQSPRKQLQPSKVRHVVLISAFIEALSSPSAPTVVELLQVKAGAKRGRVLDLKTSTVP